jgi:hypothetical protein
MLELQVKARIEDGVMAGSDRRLQSEDERAPIDPNAFEQSKVECLEMRQFTRAGHCEDQSQHRTATRERQRLRRSREFTHPCFPKLTQAF